jgi:hypothetical protein
VNQLKTHSESDAAAIHIEIRLSGCAGATVRRKSRYAPFLFSSDGKEGLKNLAQQSLNTWGTYFISDDAFCMQIYALLLRNCSKMIQEVGDIDLS